MTICTSLRSPSTKDARSGRSIRRQTRIASVEGRPSRRKNEPGILPAAYERSSTSTVSGKKSKPSRGFLPALVAERSIVSSSRYAATAPCACCASRPVSNRTVRVPKRPLSRTASAAVISGPSKRSLLLCLDSRARLAHEHSKEQEQADYRRATVVRVYLRWSPVESHPASRDGEPTTGDQLAAGLLRVARVQLSDCPKATPPA